MNELLPLSELLKTHTQPRHSVLDKRIMQLKPFANYVHYQSFLRMQLRLHSAVEPIYQDAVLMGLIPRLKDRCRTRAVLLDCADLSIPEVLQLDDQHVAGAITITDPYIGLGWLYTVEGSTLGAAMLLKHVKHSLNLSEHNGARHMTSHANGRTKHWRAFKEAINALSLTKDQRERVVEGANQAFAFALESVEATMAQPEKETA
ncbi:biliverdin-producing heme oxygenase [Neptunomonas phycophila]|uniref:biliverdin-producing heme oxygenase n=1 Tax=Neptunomonas phycophila TaxID=1572645 RepID=UPI0009491A85|nr:biliverdin-producing heme oxygenase [Neptunomonas phycophila]